MLYSKILSLTLLLNLVSAKVDVPFFTKDELALEACQGLIGATAKFCATKKGAKASKKLTVSLACLCKNKPALGTFTQCYMLLGNVTSHIEYFLDSCEKEANTTITLDKFYQAYENSTKFLIDPDTKGFNATKITNSPVSLTKEDARMYFRSYLGVDMNWNTSNYYGTVMIAYWGVVMLVCSIFNWTVYFFPQLANIAIVKQYRQYLSMPAVHRTQSSDAKFMKIFHYLIPSRLDTVLIGIWIVLCIAFQCSRYIVEWPNATYKTRDAMLGRIVADRSGITSLYCFPILILFAGRNNFLQFFTRWKFSRMIAIHRWVARITVLLVFIHTVAMSIAGWAVGKFFKRNNQEYVQWGWVAMVAGTIILIQGCLFLRRKSYEAFYIIHLLMALLFTIGGWRHVDYVDFGPWYFAASAVWLFDRVIRIIRLCFFGFPEALVELKAEETLRVTVPRPAYWKSEPGQHAFVHFLRPSCFWQSHPFTMIDCEESQNTIRFYIKIKGGVTHGLYKYLVKQQTHSAKIRVSVEGPYGSGLPLKRFNQILFISGGNGIPGLFAEALDLVRKNNAKQSVKFYWVIRQWKSLDWFVDELKQLENTKITPIVYITNPDDLSGLTFNWSSSSSTSSENNSETKSEFHEKYSGSQGESEEAVAAIKLFLPHVEFRRGRPNIKEIVQQSIDEADGSLAVVGCGHSNMIDDTRAAVVHQMSSTKKLVEFYDQLQTCLTDYHSTDVSVYRYMDRFQSKKGISQW